MQNNAYWLREDYVNDPRYGWNFLTINGDQGSSSGKSASYYSWAVRDGDVSIVPIPAAVWLYGSALAGLFVARRKK